MNFPQFLNLPYWNQLAKSHLSELVMVLTAAVVVLLDRQVKKLVNKFTRTHGRVFRFVVFLFVCSVGYTALSLGCAWALKEGLTFRKGIYMAPIALGILIIVAIAAERQRQI